MVVRVGDRVPMEVRYDDEHAEYTAFNDAFRVAAAGNTEAEARWRFRSAVAALFAEEVLRIHEQRQTSHGQASPRELAPT